jgi:hypothetical protein
MAGLTRRIRIPAEGDVVRGRRTPGRRSLVAVAAVALGAGLPAGAQAIPITSLRVSTDPERIVFQATLQSPASATSCTANVKVALVDRYVTRQIKGLGNHRINVCRDGSSGTTRGYLRGWFAMHNIRAGDYRLCLRAVQNLRNGGVSAHIRCQIFRWRG